MRQFKPISCYFTQVEFVRKCQFWVNQQWTRAIIARCVHEFPNQKHLSLGDPSLLYTSSLIAFLWCATRYKLRSKVQNWFEVCAARESVKWMHANMHIQAYFVWFWWQDAASLCRFCFLHKWISTGSFNSIKHANKCAGNTAKNTPKWSETKRNDCMWNIVNWLHCENIQNNENLI